MSTSTCVSSSAASAASSAPKRGALIVFEGLDRSGKSTQAAKLVDVLNESGRKASLQRFPDRSTVIGGLCDAYLQQATQLDDRCIHLLFSANRFEAVASILERINRGETVVVDRYSFSGIAYSVFKGLDWDWCCAPEVGLPKPDSVYFLTVSDQVRLTQTIQNSSDMRYLSKLSYSHILCRIFFSTPCPVRPP